VGTSGRKSPVCIFKFQIGDDIATSRIRTLKIGFNNPERKCFGDRVNIHSIDGKARYIMPSNMVYPSIVGVVYLPFMVMESPSQDTVI
jgi:hypothetical protein